MDIPTTFMPLLAVFTNAMTKPTGESFRQLIAGWIFAPRRAIPGALRAANPTKHHSAYHRIFASARWSTDQVGLAVFDLVVRLTNQTQYYLVGDDTLVHKRGLKVYGAGMHRDACNSSSGLTSFRWGHCWVVLCVLVPSRKDPNRNIGTDARLVDPPAPRKKGQRGRTARRGAVLPKPSEMLKQRGLRRCTLKLYQKTTYKVRITSKVCRLYLAPEREVKVVAVEHLRGGRGTEVFYSTEVSLSEEEVLASYSFRWPVESTFEHTKGHLGLGEAQNWGKRAVRRTTPSTLYLYGLIVLWHEQVRAEPGGFVRNWRGKEHASFADMLATLRGDSLRETQSRYFSAGGLTPAAEKLLRPLRSLLSLAA